MNWNTLDTWIVITAGLVAMACVLPGVFLLLSRQSMVAHGIAHAVLPGIVLGHLATGGVETPALLTGAVFAGILCAVLTRFLQNFSGVDSGAALGISFTTLFALGLILQRLLADHVHIEPSHVLYGNLETAIFDVIISGTPFPAAAQRALGAFLLNLLFVFLLYKELVITTFDPHHGDTVGARPRMSYYLLMAISALTCVIAFEAVGSILVVAMMIIPPAIASLFTNDIKKLILSSLLIALACTVAGHILSLGALGNNIARLLGFQEVGSTNTAAGIVLVSSLCFVLSSLGRKYLKRAPAPPEPLPTISPILNDKLSLIHI